MAYKTYRTQDDPGTVGSDPNAPVAGAPQTPPQPAYTPVPENQRPPKPTAPPTSVKGPVPTEGYDWVWQEGPVWNGSSGAWETPSPSWQWQRTGPYQPTIVESGDPRITPTDTTSSTDPMAIITKSLQTAYGRAPTPQDTAYWMAAWNQWGSKDPAYFEKRLLGYGAGPQDFATAGPYAGGQGYTVPGAAPAMPQYTLPELPAISGPSYGGGAASSYTGAASEDPFASMGGGVYENGGWKPRSMYTPEQLAQYDAQRTGGSTGGSTTTSSSSSSSTPVTQAQLDQERNAAILKLLQAKPPTGEELRASPEAQAYMLQSQRGAERQRADLAERAAYEGFNDTGFFETELAGQQQQRAES